MGCTVSKLDNEDKVRRCKERRRLKKEAVHARHHLAAAHVDYYRSLRLTGSALVSFASGDNLFISDQSPLFFLHSTTTTPTIPKTNHVPTHVATPPPSMSYAPSPIMDSGKLPHILSDAPSRRRRKERKQPKPPPSAGVRLPHILSESSLNSSLMSQNWGYPTAFQVNSTYSRIPSQTSQLRRVK